MSDIKYADNVKDITLSQNGDEEATKRLVVNNMPLVKKIASHFLAKGTEYDDLCQLGTIGLLNAIRGFDTKRGTAFSTYAVPLILGEIRRYLRDDGLVKIGREKKKQGAEILRAREEFMTRNGYEPGIRELAEICKMSVEEAASAIESTYPVKSLHERAGDSDELTLGNLIPSEDELEESIDVIALKESISKMPLLWRQIISLRYFSDYSQSQTADILGLSQVKISREEKKIFSSLKAELA